MTKEVQSTTTNIVFGGVEFAAEDFMRMTENFNSITDLFMLREVVASMVIEDELQTIEVEPNAETEV